MFSFWFWRWQMCFALNVMESATHFSVKLYLSFVKYHSKSYQYPIFKTQCLISDIRHSILKCVKLYLRFVKYHSYEYPYPISNIKVRQIVSEFCQISFISISKAQRWDTFLVNSKSLLNPNLLHLSWGFSKCNTEGQEVFQAPLCHTHAQIQGVFFLHWASPGKLRLGEFRCI